MSRYRRAIGYMRMTGLLRWKVRCWDMIDAARAGTPSGCENLYEAKTCPPYWVFLKLIFKEIIMMMKAQLIFHRFFLMTVVMFSLTTVSSHAAESAEDLNREATQALQSLIKSNPVAADFSKIAKAVLVFPKIVKAGLVFGGSYGEGVLMKNGSVTGYYNSVGISWGLQAGAQSYGYVLFLMNDKAINYLEKSKGWEVGVGPSVVVMNEGVAKNISTTTLKDDAYAFIFDMQGLMASASIEGTKISHIKR